MVFVPKYILILGLTIVIDYLAGIWIEKSVGKKRKLFLIISLVANIGILALFKYYNFFIDNLNNAISLLDYTYTLPLLGILLPIGLSFHTFQAMSYTIEVYRGNQKAEKHFGIYSLYVMFYPQLVAGPIERPQNVLHQFHQNYTFDLEKLKSGLMQISFGLLKKVVIADRLAILVDEVYGSPDSYDSTSLLIATIFYSFQIYCDFSGYSDIGIGAARIMGFTLMKNFDSPYESKSVTEFWRRWHISLSTWFRDYLYIPLGGNRVSFSRALFNVLVVFLISGLWHGANWTFIVWGGLHGFFLIIENVFRKKVKLRSSKESILPWILKPLGVLYTFSLVCFAWVFFRSDSLDTSFKIIDKLFVNTNYRNPAVSISENEIIISIILIIILLVKEHLYSIIPTKNNFYFILKLLVVLLFCYFFGVFGQNQFIYFQF